MLFMALRSPEGFCLIGGQSISGPACCSLSSLSVCLSVLAPALLARCPQDLGAHMVFSVRAQEVQGWVPLQDPHSQLHDLRQLL